jgi:hypothetical protein
LKPTAGILRGRPAAIEQFKHPTKRGLVTVPGKPGDDLAIGTLMSIWKQAQIEGEG